MAEAQSQSPSYMNGQPVPFMVPGQYGKIRVLRLTVPAGGSVVLSDANNYPKGDATTPKEAPSIIGWFLVNRSAQDLVVTDETEKDTGHGMHLAALSGTTPGTLGWQLDPDEVYVYNAATGDVEVDLILMGYFPS